MHAPLLHACASFPRFCDASCRGNGPAAGPGFQTICRKCRTTEDQRTPSPRRRLQMSYRYGLHMSRGWGMWSSFTPQDPRTPDTHRSSCPAYSSCLTLRVLHVTYPSVLQQVRLWLWQHGYSRPLAPQWLRGTMTSSRGDCCTPGQEESNHDEAGKPKLKTSKTISNVDGKTADVKAVTTLHSSRVCSEPKSTAVTSLNGCMEGTQCRAGSIRKPQTTLAGLSLISSSNLSHNWCLMTSQQAGQHL